MKKLVYKVIVGEKGLEDFEAQVTKKLNEGWKPLGGIQFNHGFPHQSLAKLMEISNPLTESDKSTFSSNKTNFLTANQAIKKLDELT